MIKVGGTPERRRYERHECPRRFCAATPGKAEKTNRQFEGVIKDISAGGAALSTGERLENDQFATPHIEGIGVIKAQVRRAYDGGFAVEFDIDDQTRTQIQEGIARFRENMRKQGGKA